MNIFRRIIGKCCHLLVCNISRFLELRGKVLMLHWIGDEEQLDETSRFQISKKEFRTLLSWLKTQNVTRLEDWEYAADFVALTIDDVPQNFYENAFPLLKEYEIPFTLFVNISLLDKVGYITKSQLIEMSQCRLCTIGSHGVNHGEFALLNKKEALKELLDSKHELERLVNKPVRVFAFPYGSYYACGYRHKYMAGEVYKYAFGTVASPITRPSLLKKYFLPRINVDERLLNKVLILEHEDRKCDNSLL